MSNYQNKREELLKEMGKITCMHPGRLSQEYRESQAGGKKLLLGPYYKHQQWCEGKNVSRRVKPEEAEALRRGIEGMDCFKKLSAEYIEATVAMTQEGMREQDGKKNSR